MSQKNYVILARFYLDTGTEYLAAHNIQHPQVLYEGRVTAFGTIQKSIPNPVGIPQIAQAKITLADPDRKWRDLLSIQTARRRIFELKFLKGTRSVNEPADSESGTPSFFVGEVVSCTFTTASVEIDLEDRSHAWIDEEIPAIGIRDFYSYIQEKDEGAFLSLIFGNMVTPTNSPPGPAGQIPCPHMGQVATGDRFGVAMHPVALVYAVYRKETITVNDSTNLSEWVYIDPTEYSVVEDTVVAYGITLNPTYIDFVDTQAEGTEIRADVLGINSRGAWGSLPAIVASPTPVRNPIDCFINAMFFILTKAGIPQSVFDVAEIEAIRQHFEDLALVCDGAVTEVITCRDFLAWFLTSFNLDFFQNRKGLLTLAFVDQSDPNRMLISEGRLILKETFQESLPDKPISEFVYRFQENPADKTWSTFGVFDVTEDQQTLGSIEREVLDLHFVRDPVDAIFLVQYRSDFLRLGAYTQQFECPLPEVINLIDLASLVGITHKMGLEVGGYVNHEAKVIGLTYNLDTFKCTVNTILRIPRELEVLGPGSPGSEPGTGPTTGGGPTVVGPLQITNIPTDPHT